MSAWTGLIVAFMLLIGMVIIMSILVLEAFGVFDEWYRKHPPGGRPKDPVDKLIDDYDRGNG